jgi:hypothetical protein
MKRRPRLLSAYALSEAINPEILLGIVFESCGAGILRIYCPYKSGHSEKQQS